MTNVSFDGYERELSKVKEGEVVMPTNDYPEPNVKAVRKPQKKLGTRYLSDRDKFMADPRFVGIKPFESKVWS
ncbi:MAG: hypothetical protein IJ189_12650 [Clostridia bacterium]|nr:hypothetical protein [Clostridia bacterium]